MKNYTALIQIEIRAKDRKDAWRIAQQVGDYPNVNGAVYRVSEEGD